VGILGISPCGGGARKATFTIVALASGWPAAGCGEPG